jgi:hypothetical protein
MKMAKYIHRHGGKVAGNYIDSAPRTLYCNDPAIAAPGLVQQRNLRGSVLPGDLGCGVSLGSWASTAVCDSTDAAKNRPAMRLITVEFPGYKRPIDYSKEERATVHKGIQLYAAAISRVFLGNHHTEND